MPSTAGVRCDGVAAVREMRCGCGSLLARRVRDGVELKCRRCKRAVVLSLRAIEGGKFSELRMPCSDDLPR